MDEKEREAIAVFRYGIIAPVLHSIRRNQKSYFEEMAKDTYDVPHLGRRRYRWTTFKKWLKVYRSEGFEGLKPRTRGDKGRTRKINERLSETILSIKETMPFLTPSNLYRRLLSEGHITTSPISEGTLRNFLKVRGLDKIEKGKDTKGRRKFELPFVNDLWTGDFMHGPRGIILDRKKSRLYLMAIIDDHTRMIVGARFFDQENIEAVEKVLRRAILTYGIPKRFYCDNGAAFSSNHLSIICARLGIALIHSKPYDSPSRGKIERLFRTIRERFLNPLNLNSITSFVQLNKLFLEWIDQDYHKQYHSGIGERPIDRYIKSLKDVKIRRIEEKELDHLLYQTIRRRVKNDSTVSIGSKLYEAPPEYIGTIIEIRFPTERPDDLTLYEDGKPICPLKPLDIHLNSKAPSQGISFSTNKNQKEKEET